jgi:hypothetical protein
MGIAFQNVFETVKGRNAGMMDAEIQMDAERTL